jgi:sortase A
MPPDDNQATGNNNDYALPIKKDKVVKPLHDQLGGDNPAVNVIRNKIASLYGKEPSPEAELSEARAAGKHRSKHQQFMYDLSRSGKTLAEIQTAWHNYYTSLPDHEKHAVWQEFYANYSHATVGAVKKPVVQTVPQTPATPKHTIKKHHEKPSERRSVSDIKQQLLGTVSSRARKKASRHGSLLFGLGVGVIVMIMMLFGFFNERFIAPFITPSKAVSSTPIIVDTTAAVGPEPKLIIPKINLEVPVVYDEPSVDEDAVQRALEDGVLHYATTPNPGELGNAVIFGHSSNNILNRGKYKFAFVLLNRLEKGDTFMVHKEGKRYIYRVVDTKVVKPTDISVLGPTDRPATVTLITCDPPGTAINRLVVVGEQIAPDPAANVASNVNSTGTSQPEVLPSNAPSLWSRFTTWLSG